MEIQEVARSVSIPAVNQQTSLHPIQDRIHLSPEVEKINAWIDQLEQMADIRLDKIEAAHAHLKIAPSEMPHLLAKKILEESV